MNEVEFIEFLNSCISALKSAKGIGLEIRKTTKTSENNYQVLFIILDTGKYFEINFYWPAVEKINTDEEKIQNGKLVVKKLYQNVRIS